MKIPGECRMAHRTILAMVLCGFTLLAQTSPPLAEVRKAAEQGDAAAQAQIGRAYLLGLGVPKDATEALKWYRKAAEQGNPNAQSSVGFMYEWGQGVAQDYAEAVRWYRKAAGQGNHYAQFNLGVMYNMGQGVAQDYAEAVRWYRKAAEQGDPNAQFNLGLLYTKGQGVVQDDADAAGWYRKAAEQGDPDAQSYLGFIYNKGQGVAQDYPEAVRWYRKAAERGNATAQYNLGLIYIKGQGVAQDFVEAHMWIGLAASKVSGDDQKRRAAVRDSLEKKMTAQQIAEAERRTREWKPVEPSPSERASRGPLSADNGGVAFQAPSPVVAQNSAPTVLTNVGPEYSEEGRKACFAHLPSAQGTVTLSVVVGADGQAHDITIAKPLGLGLDEKAMEAVMKWRFNPGLQDGKPVNARATVDVHFTCEGELPQPQQMPAPPMPATARGADRVAPNTATGGGSCIKYGNTTSWRSNPGRGLSRTFGAQYVEWYTQLDSTACRALRLPGPTTASPFPLAVRVTVHAFQDQAETTEVPFPPDQETTLDFLIDRNERTTVHGQVKVARATVKESNWIGVRVQVVVADTGQALIRSLQEAQVSDLDFCRNYAISRFTGKMTPYKRNIGSGPEEVPDPSKGNCLKGKAMAMAERFMNEHSELSSATGVVLCPDSACVQSHLDSTVPNTTNVSKFIEGTNVYSAVRTFEKVNATCENAGTTCMARTRFGYGHWTVTGAMNEAMHVSGNGRPDYDELNVYQFTCTASVNPLRARNNDSGPSDTHDLVPLGQTIAGKHSANDSYVICSAQRTK